MSLPRRLRPLALGLGLALAVPATTAGVPVPVFASGVELAANIPDAAAISVAFDPSRPYAYVSTLHGIDVYEISDPTLPVPTGTLPMAFFQNEAMSVGQPTTRDDGTTFVIVGTDLAGAVTPTSPTQSAPATSYHLYVVDVTDPHLPVLRGDTGTSTNTHTVSCIDPDCLYAYTAGTNDEFSVIDLTDLDAPVETSTIPDTWGWHDWDVDAAGIAWQAADFGTVAMDVTDPLAPVILNSTDLDAVQGQSEHNNYIHHNSSRPYAQNFTASADPAAASIFDGNVLLVTEEDMQAVDCTDEGSFQTWFIPSLEVGDNPDNVPGNGTISVLDAWQTELYGIQDRDQFGLQCSAHYFDVHQDGFVAQAWYDQGVRILDVRDPSDIKQVGYWVTQSQLAWSAYFVPERDASGAVVVDPDTGEVQRTDVVWVADAARGIDVLEVTLPEAAPSDTVPVRAPILDSWRTGGGAALTTSAHPELGWACRLVLTD